MKLNDVTCILKCSWKLTKFREKKYKIENNSKILNQKGQCYIVHKYKYTNAQIPKQAN